MELLDFLVMIWQILTILEEYGISYAYESSILIGPSAFAA